MISYIPGFLLEYNTAVMKLNSFNLVNSQLCTMEQKNSTPDGVVGEISFSS